MIVRGYERIVLMHAHNIFSGFICFLNCFILLISEMVKLIIVDFCNPLLHVISALLYVVYTLF